MRRRSGAGPDIADVRVAASRRARCRAPSARAGHGRIHAANVVAGGGGAVRWKEEVCE